MDEAEPARETQAFAFRRIPALGRRGALVGVFCALGAVAIAAVAMAVPLDGIQRGIVLCASLAIVGIIRLFVRDSVEPAWRFVEARGREGERLAAEAAAPFGDPSIVTYGLLVAAMFALVHGGRAGDAAGVVLIGLALVIPIALDARVIRRVRSSEPHSRDGAGLDRLLQHLAVPMVARRHFPALWATCGLLWAIAWATLPLTTGGAPVSILDLALFVVAAIAWLQLVRMWDAARKRRDDWPEERRLAFDRFVSELGAWDLAAAVVWWGAVVAWFVAKDLGSYVGVTASIAAVLGAAASAYRLWSVGTCISQFDPARHGMANNA